MGKEILGYPVSILRDREELAADPLPEHVPLRQLPETHGRTVAVAGVRLPGWTGGKGFYLWDGETWVIVREEGSSKAPAPWKGVRLRGRWTVDEWRFSWFQADSREGYGDGVEHESSR